MTHKQALSDKKELRPEEQAGAACDGKLIDASWSFSSDVKWEVFTCDKCFATVFTVEGGVHWWNGHGEPSPARAARVEAMRAQVAIEGSDR